MNTGGGFLPRQPQPNPCSRSSLRAPVAVSPTHVHLTVATIETLFCDHYCLHAHHRLGQPALYEAEETVTLIGPGGRLNHVPVIGPPRLENQIEVSHTDAQVLGIEVPLRRSGHVARTPSVLIKGPRTSIRLESCLIRALRHAHMTPAEAESIGVHDGGRLDAVILTHTPLTLLRDVLVRASPDFRLELHLDMDEAHRLDLKSGDQVELRRQSAHPHAQAGMAINP
jgi:propanediol utilization protein